MADVRTFNKVSLEHCGIELIITLIVIQTLQFHFKLPGPHNTAVVYLKVATPHEKHFYTSAGMFGNTPQCLPIVRSVLICNTKTTPSSYCICFFQVCQKSPTNKSHMGHFCLSL